MNWKRMLAYISGSVDEELLLQNEYLVTESRVAGTSGTPVYMSPQQLLGEDPSAADDIYALGATLYEFRRGRFRP